MSTHKIGSTVRFLLKFDDEKWAALYPYDSVKAEAKPTKALSNGVSEYEMNITVDVASKTIIVSADTQTWALEKATYRFDLRFEKNGEYIFIPAEGGYEFRLSPPITDGE